MSQTIADGLQSIINAKTDIDGAVEAKGGIVTKGLENSADDIMTIPNGEGPSYRSAVLWDYTTDNDGTIPYEPFIGTLHDSINNYDAIQIEMVSYRDDLDTSDWNATMFSPIIPVYVLNNSLKNNYFNHTSFETRSTNWYIKDTTIQKVVTNLSDTNGLVRLYGIKFYGGGGTVADEDALIELVDSGAKNLSEWAGGTTETDDSFVVQNEPITLKQGTYVISFDTTADSGSCEVVFSDANDNVGSHTFDNISSSTLSSEITLTADAIKFNLFTTKAATITNFMICTKAAWGMSHEYQPYRPSYQELYEQTETNAGILSQTYNSADCNISIYLCQDNGVGNRSTYYIADQSKMQFVVRYFGRLVRYWKDGVDYQKFRWSSVGLIATNNSTKKDMLTLDIPEVTNETYVKIFHPTDDDPMDDPDGTFTWRKSSVNVGDVWYIRPHIEYTDLETGMEYTMYGAVYKVTVGTPCTIECDTLSCTELTAREQANENNISSVQEQANWNSNNGVKNLAPVSIVEKISSSTGFTVQTNCRLTAGSYIISFNYTTTSSASPSFFDSNGNLEKQLPPVNGSGHKRLPFTVTSQDDIAGYYFYTFAAAKFENIMICPALIKDDTFEPYAMSNAELTAREQANENNISLLQEQVGYAISELEGVL